MDVNVNAQLQVEDNGTPRSLRTTDVNPQANNANDFAIPVANTSTVVIAANPDRLELAIINDSDYDIYLGRNQAAQLGRGILLKAGGGAYVTNAFLGSINAIHGSTGFKNLLVAET